MIILRQLSPVFHGEGFHDDALLMSTYNIMMFCGIQSNLDGSNTNGSFTMADSNSFLSPCEILPIAQENEYLRKFSYFIVKLYVLCTH